jgi:hypothetical protein
VNPAISERVSKSVTMVVGTGDSVDACASKTTCDNTLFLCPVAAEDCDDTDELALVVRVNGLEMVSLGAGGLAQTCITSFVGSEMLGVKVLWVILVEMGDCSTFPCFWVKPTVVDRISGAVMIVEGAVELYEVIEGVVEKKMQIFGEISLFFAFFPSPFPGSAASGDCVVAAQ